MTDALDFPSRVDVEFSHSSLSTWRRCRVRFFWQYVQGYTPRSSEGQMRGTIGHAAMAAYYKTHDHGVAMQAAQAAANKFEMDDPTVNVDELWELTEPVLQRYMDWADENDHFDETVATELKFDLLLDGYKFTGYIDAIIKFQGALFIMEHKFQKRADNKHIDLDAQVSLYMMAAHMLGYAPRAIIYNVVKMDLGPKSWTDPVLRKLTFRGAEGIQVVAEETRREMAELTTFLANPKGGTIYRNETKECSWDCPFYNACLSLNSTGDAEESLKRIPRLPFEVRKEMKANDEETD